MLQQLKGLFETISIQARRQKMALLLSSYLMFGGDTPLPKAMTKPLYQVAIVGHNVFGRLARFSSVLNALRGLKLLMLAMPFGPLITATAFSYRVAHAALLVEMKHHKLA